MGAPEFRTVADALIPCARAAHAHFRTHGYRVKIEAAELGAPFTPTLTAIRDLTTLHVEVVSSLDVARLREWTAYGKSTGRDTRLAVCMPNGSTVGARSMGNLRALRVGLYIVELGTLAERIPPEDLALGVELPALAKRKAQVRTLLGHSYEQFGKGEWRGGFEDACQALEVCARRYLKRWSPHRIRISRKTGPIQLTSKQINKMTMGDMGRTFLTVVAPTQLDVTIGQTLLKLNRDRIAIVHHKQKKTTERRLRTNVGHHMWLIVTVLDQMHK